MNGFMKALTALLGAIAVIACIATVGILGYSFISNDSANNKTAKALTEGDFEKLPDDVILASPVPTVAPSISDSTGQEPVSVDPNHIHDYKTNIITKATCLESGQIEYICSCGDSYVVDQMSTGHVPDDWEIVRAATTTEDGLKVRKCIYCDEVIASETIPATGTGVDANGSPLPKHEHLYIATTEREPSCTLAGLRKLTCSCGDFYTETIPAIGHVATDWTTAEEATSDTYGRSQRVCSVCGAILDVKSLPLLSPSPSASASASASSSAATSASPGTSGSKTSPTPSPTPHVHKYSSYVVTPATCTTKGIRSYVCNCGSSYAESIELDLNNHSYQATFVAPTDTQQGYTIYTCTRCNYSYKDNYIMPLTNNAPEETE